MNFEKTMRILVAAAILVTGAAQWYEELVDAGVLPRHPTYCVDEDGWFAKKPSRDCGWHGKKAVKRCVSEVKVKAEDACAATCTGEGEDSSSWYAKRQNKDCDWIAKKGSKIGKLCKRKGVEPVAPEDDPTVHCTKACAADDACETGIQYHCPWGNGNGPGDGKYEFWKWDPKCSYTTVMTPLENPAGCTGDEPESMQNCAATCNGAACFQPDCGAESYDLSTHPCCTDADCSANGACGVYRYPDSSGNGPCGLAASTTAVDDGASDAFDSGAGDSGTQRELAPVMAESGGQVVAFEQEEICGADDVDDPSWHKDGKPSRNCDWIRVKPLERCLNVEAVDSNNVTASDACRCACQHLHAAVESSIMHPWSELNHDLAHEKQGPIVSIPIWTRIRFMTPSCMDDGLCALHFHNLIAGNQYLGASFYYNCQEDDAWCEDGRFLGRDVITASGAQYISLFATILFGDCQQGDCHEEEYQWLFHINTDLAPVSADEDSEPCPSLHDARMGNCLVVDVPYDEKYRTSYKFHDGGIQCDDDTFC